jgi:hypothetical protein
VHDARLATLVSVAATFRDRCSKKWKTVGCAMRTMTVGGGIGAHGATYFFRLSHKTPWCRFSQLEAIFLPDIHHAVFLKTLILRGLQFVF